MKTTKNIFVAGNKKNQKQVNKVIKALIAYNGLDNERNRIECTIDNDKAYNRISRKCENAFDRYIDELSELPKYEQERIEASDIYKLGYDEKRVNEILNKNEMETTEKNQIKENKKTNVIKSLLSKGTSNAKTAKNEINTFILYLSPFKENNYGKNVCANASIGCIESCLFTAGFAGVYHSVNEARKAKTNYLFSDQIGFLKQLTNELIKISKNSSKKGIKTAIRLNGTSDLDFVQLIKVRLDIDILTLPNLMFYDYTKNINKALKYKDCSNYKITFSRSETNESDCLKALRAGINVAVVFDHKKALPSTYLGYKVIDGDKSDIEMISNYGVILGLKAKGKAKKNINGFVVSI